jgi:hypothetical protein
MSCFVAYNPGRYTGFMVAVALSDLTPRLPSTCWLCAHPTYICVCRYTGFMVLYPLGVSSELTMAWLALPAMSCLG